MFAQEGVMDIQNIVTEQDTETLDAEIAAMTAAFTEEHYLNNDEAEHLEMIAAKSMVLGELYERAKWQAKAQAVPEGFVLVPMVPSERMINAVRQCYEGEAYLPYSLYSEFVNQAIIERMEAQEPTND